MVLRPFTGIYTGDNSCIMTAACATTTASVVSYLGVTSTYGGPAITIPVSEEGDAWVEASYENGGSDNVVGTEATVFESEPDSWNEKLQHTTETKENAVAEKESQNFESRDKEPVKEGNDKTKEQTKPTEEKYQRWNKHEMRIIEALPYVGPYVAFIFPLGVIFPAWRLNRIPRAED